MCIRDRYAERIEHHLQRLTILQERHILFRKYPGNYTFVSVPAGHLIADAYFSLRSYIAANKLIDARRKLIAVIAGEYLDIHHDTSLTVRYSQRRVSDFSGLCLLYTSRCV